MKRLLLILTLSLCPAALLSSQRWVVSNRASNPIALYVLPGQSRFAITGRIEERLPAGSYLYLRLRDARGASHWIVTLRDSVPALDNIEATVYGRAESFYSKRLRRSFAPLSFAAVRAAGPVTSSTHAWKKEGP